MLVVLLRLKGDIVLIGQILPPRRAGTYGLSEAMGAEAILGGSVILAGGTGSLGGGVIINTNGTQPPCDSSIRGMLWFIQGAPNIKDSFEICAKDASNSYTWRTLY